MSYRYAAAPGYTAPQATRPAPQTAPSTNSQYRSARPAPAPPVASYTEDNTGRSIRERRHATTRVPDINVPTDTRARGPRSARFREDPSPAHLHPGGQYYAPATPMTPASAYTSSPRAPSLSHSTDGEHDDDQECPPTPEHVPIPPPVNTNNKPRSRTSSPISPEHQASYAAIEKIIYEMSLLVLSFQCPADLEFKPAPLDGPVPGLTFTSQNRPIHEQNQKLEKLQGRLDAVDSHDDMNIRKARKAAVEEVERALETVKWMQTLAWKKHVYEQRKKR